MLALLLTIIKTTSSLARKSLNNDFYLIDEFLQSCICLSLSNASCNLVVDSSKSIVLIACLRVLFDSQTRLI